MPLVVVLACTTAATTARAQEAPEPDIGDAVACVREAGCTSRPQLLDDVRPAAEAAGVAPADVLGALNTLADAGIETDATSYLRSLHELATTPATRGYTARVRLTYYTEAGVTYGGGHTAPGTAACSWNFPLQTTVIFRDGERVVCRDRGRLGATGWVDVWRQAPLAAKYGPTTSVRVVLP